MENTEVRLKEKIKLKMVFTKEIKMKLLVGYLISNLLYILISSYLFITKITEFKYANYSIGLKNLLIVNCIILLVIIIKKKYKKNIAHIGIILAIIFGFISMWFAVDRNMALEGFKGRYEGLYSILYYLTLMLLTTFVKGKYKKYLVKTILFCGAVQAIYAICQSFNLFNAKQFYYYSHLWITGLVGHPNFLGTYMLLCLSYSLGLVIDSKKIKSIVIYSIFATLYMFALLLSNTASGVVGLAFVGIFILIYTIKNKLYKKLIFVITIISSVTFIVVVLGKTTLVEDIIKVGNEATEVAKGNSNDEFGTNRMYIWKKTMEVVPKYLLHGAGVDNFTKAFNGEALLLKRTDKTILYDKAHNEYLQTLVTQGVFALASYLFIYGYAVFKGTKHAFKNKEIYFVLPVIGYLVQAFFNISVIEVAPMFNIALGLCCGSTNSNKNDNEIIKGL